jgi:hydroxycarboxylate dehydrogenase B
MIAHPDRLKTLVAQVFVTLKCGDDEAQAIADHLVEANLAGHDSHGVIRVPYYAEWVRKEMVIPGRSCELLLDTEALTVVDAQRGFGQWVGKQAVQIGIDKCAKQGISLLAIRNSGHLGRIGTWAEQAAAAGLVSLHFVNTTGLGMMVVPAGGKERRLSVNPVCIGVPVQDAAPVVLDIAAAATAEGKLKVARNKGVPVPDNWIVDSEGNPTNDPNKFYGPPVGAILPVGGHKGFGLGFIAELLAGALTGGGCSKPGVTQLEQGMLSIFIDPLKLRSAESLFPEITRYIEFVKSCQPVEEGGEVLVPGDVEEKRRAQLANGIELDAATWSQVSDAAKECGIPDSEIETVLVSK